MKRFDGARATEVQSFGFEAARKMVIGPPHRFDEGEEPEEDIRALADDIFARGQLQRCSFTEDSAGRVVLTAGRRRRLAVLYINEHPERYEIPPKVMEKYGGWPLECEWGGKATDVQNALVAVAENIKRRAYSPIDLMLAALHFTEHCGMTQEDCVEPLGLNSQSDVSRLLALVPLGHGVHSLVHKGTLRPNQARQLLGLTPEEISPVVAHIEAGVKPAKVLAELRASRRKGAVGKPVKRKRSEFIEEAKAHGSPLAQEISFWLDGEPAVGTLAEILTDADRGREFFNELADLDDVPLVTDLKRWFKGDPEVGSLTSILVEESLRRKGIETRAAEAAEKEQAA